MPRSAGSPRKTLDNLRQGADTRDRAYVARVAERRRERQAAVGMGARQQRTRLLDVELSDRSTRGQITTSRVIQEQSGQATAAALVR